MEEEIESLAQKLLETLKNIEELELEDVEIELGNLEFWLQPSTPTLRPPALRKPRPEKLVEEVFTPPSTEYPGSVVEVKIGATKTEGGTRSRSLKIGGEKAPPFYMFEEPPPNLPVISIDVFDMS
ncbi:MAG: CO dehydrogenase/acetyl-CoA synthase subunit delta, partial [Nitrososphaeria archaeon]|nr:CO dehydrogenase/acetyl-CoA synthase subunit delta [Nitrososphaeria archaeon]